MLDLTPTLPVAASAPRTGKIIKNDLNVFEKEGNLLQNGIKLFRLDNRIRKLEFTQVKNRLF